MPEVRSAVQMVRKAHQPVTGVSERVSYSANQPPLAAWVQNTLTDSFLEAHQTFCRPLNKAKQINLSKSNPKSEPF